jgi:hypothetical protein
MQMESVFAERNPFRVSGALLPLCRHLRHGNRGNRQYYTAPMLPVTLKPEVPIGGIGNPSSML